MLYDGCTNFKRRFGSFLSNMLGQINDIVNFSFVHEELQNNDCLDIVRNAGPPIRTARAYSAYDYIHYAEQNELVLAPDKYMLY